MQYLGNDTYLVRLSSGKEIELTEEEIQEINQEAVDNLKQEVLNSLNEYSKLHSQAMDELRGIQDDNDYGCTHDELDNDLEDFKETMLMPLYEIVDYTISDLK